MANRQNFGAPSENGGKYRNFNLEAGSNVYRIGPAYASLAASGKWNQFIKQHYGYRSSGNEANPKGFVRTFICPEEKDRQTDMIKVPCAECALIEQTEGQVDARKARMEADGKTEEQIEAVLGVQREWLKAHNLSKRYLVLAKNQKNEWGILWLPYKAKEALDNRRKKIKAEEGVDILAIEDGAWIDFTREGEGFRNTTYSCDVVYETVVTENGKKAKVMKTDSLTDSDFDAIEATCPDLTTVGTRLTVEQIERLVESRGDSEVVDQVFSEAREVSPGKEKSPAPKADIQKAAPKASAPPKRREYDEPVEEKDPAPAKTMTVNVKVAETPPGEDGVATTTYVREEVAVDDEEAALQAQLAALRAKKAAQVEADKAKAKALVEKVTKAPTPVGDPNKLDDDEFARVYAPKNKR